MQDGCIEMVDRLSTCKPLSEKVVRMSTKFDECPGFVAFERGKLSGALPRGDRERRRPGTDHRRLLQRTTVKP